jgi:uncharacterized membrane protein
MAKMSLGVIRKDKEILLFPLISGLLTLLILAGFIGGMFFSLGVDAILEGSAQWVMLAMLFVFYVVAFFITFFFNAAMIGCATIRLNGGDPTFADGIRIAKENAGRILLWALIAATVGLIIRALQQRSGLIGIIILAVGAALGNGSASVGGVIFIGPFPIVFGAGPDAAWLIVISMVLAVVSVILFVLFRRRS